MVRPDARAASAIGRSKAPHVFVADRLRADARRDDRPARFGEDRVEDLRQQRRIVVDRAGAVDRVGHAAEFGQHGARCAPSCGVKRRERHAGLIERVGRDGGAAAAAGHDDDLAADRFIARRDREQLDRLDELIVAVDLHDPAAAQKRREDFGVARKRAGMRLRPAPGRQPSGRPETTAAICAARAPARASAASLRGFFSASTTIAITVTSGSSTKYST